MEYITCCCKPKTAVAIVSVCGYIYSIGLIICAVLFIIAIRPYDLYGFELLFYLIGLPIAFVVGQVPPIMHRKMHKNLSEESINRYANWYLFGYLYCTLAWAISLEGFFIYAKNRANFFIFLVTPFVLGNIYGYLVIKRYQKEFADSSATHQLYGRIGIASQTY